MPLVLFASPNVPTISLTGVLTINNPFSSTQMAQLRLRLDDIYLPTNLQFNAQLGTWTAVDPTNTSHLKIALARTLPNDPMNIIQLNVALQLPSLRSICLTSSDSPWYLFNGNFSRLVKDKKEYNNALLTDSNSVLSPIIEPTIYHREGFALILDDLAPWNLKYTNFPDFCFYLGNLQVSTVSTSTNFDHKDKYYDLKFRIIIGKNVQEVHQYVARSSGQLKRPQHLPASIESLLQSTIIPVVPYHSNSEPPISKVVDAIKSKKLSQFVYTIRLTLGSRWFSADNELIVNQNTVNKLEEKIKKPNDYSITLAAQFTKKSIHQAVMGRFLIHSGKDDKTDKKTYVLDFSHLEAVNWFEEMLTNLTLDTKLSGIFCELLDFNSFLPDPSRKDSTESFLIQEEILQKYPNFLTSIIASSCAASGVAHLFTAAAYKNQHLLPVVVIKVSSTDFEDSKTYDEVVSFELVKALHKILTLSLAGYPLSVLQLDSSPTAKWSFRLLKLIAFMPVIEVDVMTILPPDQASDNRLIKETWEAVHQLREFLVPKYLKLLQKWVKTGEPVIRPLWYNFPDDPEAFKIEDQFMIGEDIMVAPILGNSGIKERYTVVSDSRSVYFPKDTTWQQSSPNQTISCAGQYQIFDYSDHRTLLYFTRIRF